jgi:hypothetical protein
VTPIRIGIALAIAVVAARGVWLLVAIIDDDEASGPEPVFQTTPPPDSQVLTERRNWQLVVTPEQALELFRDSGAVSSVRGYADPPTLDEAASFLVRDDGRRATVVAGPVDDRATRVTVETPSGATMDAAVLSAHDLTWFWALFPGRVAISAIEGRDDGATSVDEFTIPTMPPPDPAVVRSGRG